MSSPPHEMINFYLETRITRRPLERPTIVNKHNNKQSFVTIQNNNYNTDT